MRTARTRGRDSGFVLVVVICMVMALAGLALAFHRKARIGLRTARAMTRSEQALSCARAGLAVGKALALAGPTSESAATWETTLDCDTGSCRMELSDEQARINLNRLMDAGGGPDRARIDQVLRLIDLVNRDGGPPIGYGIVPAILDWIDQDDQTTCLDFIQRENRGAESGFYQGMEPPYRCQNRPLQTLEELLLVRGVTPGVYRRLSPYLTVYGDGLVNLNAAPKRVIESLSEEIDSDLAQRIEDRRRMRPFQDLDEVRQVAGITEAAYRKMQGLVTVRPARSPLRIRATGQVDNVAWTLSAVLQENRTAGTVDVMGYEEHRTQKTEDGSRKAEDRTQNTELRTQKE
ncbi:MAG: general secretion pathway protein GspK [Phycisphaerae bacterium]|nr:general secretion pathway protein GspK [Phycisphaerae bacterium]